jgi:transposase-like protein
MRRALASVIPFFSFRPAIRRVLYTTNALESVHARLRKILKTRGHFPTDEAATKLLWLALRNITANSDPGRAKAAVRSYGQPEDQLRSLELFELT